MELRRRRGIKFNPSHFDEHIKVRQDFTRVRSNGKSVLLYDMHENHIKNLIKKARREGYGTSNLNTLQLELEYRKLNNQLN